jgi:hypothetical protein
MQGIAVDGPTRARKEHPLTLLRIAYGLPRVPVPASSSRSFSHAD